MSRMNKIVTIGAIGYSAEAFFRALQQAGVDTFVDVRRRRAVRGADYAFANSQRLQARLGPFCGRHRGGSVAQGMRRQN